MGRAAGCERQYLASPAVFAALLLASFVVVRPPAHRPVLALLPRGRPALRPAQARSSPQSSRAGAALQGGREAPSRRSRRSRRRSHGSRSSTSVQVFDERGKLVYQTTTRDRGATRAASPRATSSCWLRPSRSEVDGDDQREYQIRVASRRPRHGGRERSRKEAMARAIAILRAGPPDNTTALAGGLASSCSLGAVAFIWHLVQRNAQLDDRRRLDEELAALGTLAANLAHEIRNPLNALSINLELLEEDLGARRRRVGDGRARASRGRAGCRSLVNDFLVYARPAPPILEECDAADAAAARWRAAAPTCERVGIELAAGSRWRGCAATAARSPRCWSTWRSTRSRRWTDAARRVGLAARRDEGRAVLEVTDSGPGIAKAELARVREAFFSRRKGGTGLGLAIADRIVAGHGGALELVNRPGGRPRRPGDPAEGGGDKCRLHAEVCMRPVRACWSACWGPSPLPGRSRCSARPTSWSCRWRRRCRASTERTGRRTSRS